jgi:EpsI family protein
MIGITAAGLSRVQHLQTLGKPGLRMVDEAVLDEAGGVVNTNTAALPHRVLNYRSEPQPITKVELSWLPADTTYARRYYEAPDRFGLMLNVVLMGQDRTSIHRPQICLTGQGWTIELSDLLQIPVGGASPYTLPVMRLIASRPHREPNGQVTMLKAVYVYWFVADGHVTARHGERMWWMARDLLTRGTLQRWAYVACLAIGRPGSEEAIYDRLREFVAAAVPEFQLTPPPGP